MPKRSKSSEGQDYISNLPDYIIGHILSFLSTTDAVRTSTLSKRWIYMWTFVTKLYFSDGEKSPPYSIKQFSEFVSKVLSDIKSASIQDFHLQISLTCSANTNEWLSAVLNRGVKNIRVSSCNYSESYLSSYPLFQSLSLETLILQMAGPCILKVPTFVCLPSLTVLNLRKIAFTHCSPVNLEELTLKLPVLRSYTTISCTWSGVKSVTLEAPLLEEVMIQEFEFSCFRWSKSRSPTKIKFCASHLTKLYFYGYVSSLSETILVDGHIASAEIFLHNLKSTNVEETQVSLRKLLSLFTNTERLALNFYHLQHLAGVGRHLIGNPTFGMLCHLQLSFVTREILTSLLLKSPCLKTLVLQTNNSDEETQNFAIVPVPDCFLCTLKVVKIEWFLGHECELSFAKFVLENARVLERISFSFHERLTSPEVEKAKEKLLLLEKSLSTVIMEISTNARPMSVEHEKVEERPNSHLQVSQAGSSRPRRQRAKPSWMNDYVCNV